MHATLSPVDFNLFNRDLAQAYVTIRYLADSEIKEVSMDSQCQEQIEFWMGDHIVVIHHGFVSDTGESRPEVIVISVRDVIDVEVQEICEVAGDDCPTYDLALLAYWRKDRQGMLKRLSLE